MAETLEHERRAALEREHDAQLERLLDDVHRIADGIGGIRELVVRVTPNTPPAAAMARLYLGPDDVEQMRALAKYQDSDPTAMVYVPRAWLRALLKVLDDPRWVP